MKQIYDMLKLENIKILAGVKDWKEAIYTAVQPLVDGGYCEARYSDEIIKNTEKLGPYYVLCENVALIHGSTEQGVIKRQIAITLLKEQIGIKKSIKEYGIDEKYFLDTLDDMVEQAFNDQCTGANPRYPLMKEIKELYLKCYYGK